MFQALVHERQNPDLIHLLKYLKNPDLVDENQDQCGIKLRKTKSTALVFRSLIPHFPFHQGSIEETEVVVEVTHDLEKNLSKTLSESLLLSLKRGTRQLKFRTKLKVALSRRK